MTASRHPLIRRQDAVQATMERFRGKAFAFGSVDCMKVVGFHLKRLGIKVPFSKAGPYKSARGAQTALRRAGYSTVMEAMDGIGLERIAPACALIGDIVSYPAELSIGALAIKVNGGNVLCFHPSNDCLVVLTTNAEAERTATAWRAI